MREEITNRTTVLHHYSFVRIVRQTLIIIFSIVFIGTMAKTILKTVFRLDGFIYNIVFLDAIPRNVLRIIQFMLTSIGQLALGILGIYIAYMATKPTAKRYRRDGKFVGITVILTFLLMSYCCGKSSPQFSPGSYQRFLSGNSLLIVLVLGYGIGQFYWWSIPSKDGDNTNALLLLQERSSNSMLSMTINLISGTTVALFLNSNTIYHAWPIGYPTLVATAQECRQLWLTSLAIVRLTVFDRSGLDVPYTSTALTSGDSSIANLSCAFAYGTS